MAFPFKKLGAVVELVETWVSTSSTTGVMLRRDRDDDLGCAEDAFS